MSSIKQLCITAALAVSVLAMGVGTASAQETATIIYNNYLSPFDDTYRVGVKDFAQRIEQASGGAIEVKIPDASLAPANRQYEMVRGRIADMAVLGIHQVPQLQLATLLQLATKPGFAPTAEAASVALWETYQKYFKPISGFEGAKVLATWTLPGRQLLSVSDVSVQQPEDVEGAVVWAPGHTFVEDAEALGMVPLDAEFMELQQFVARGDLDLLFITPGSAASAHVLKPATGYAEIPGGFGTLAFAVIISKAKWKQLSEEQQAAVLQAAEGLSRRVGAAQDASNRKALAKLKDMDVPIYLWNDNPNLLGQQIKIWKKNAKRAGLENPEEVIDFYKTVLMRKLSDK